MSDQVNTELPQEDALLPLAQQFRFVYADHVVKDFSDESYQTLMKFCTKVHHGTSFRFPDGKVGTIFMAEFPEDWKPPEQTPVEKQEE